METVMNIIQTLGFPVACCAFLAYYIKKQNDEYRADVQSITAKYEQALSEMSEKYDKQIEKFSSSIDRNTQVLTALQAKIDGKGDEMS